MADADKDKTPEEYAAEYRAWLMECFGTLKVVTSIESLCKEEEKEPKLVPQTPALRVALELVHPETKEPLVDTVVDYSDGYQFNGRAVFLTASGRAVDGRWVDEKWILS